MGHRRQRRCLFAAAKAVESAHGKRRCLSHKGGGCADGQALAHGRVAGGSPAEARAGGMWLTGGGVPPDEVQIVKRVDQDPALSLDAPADRSQ